MAFEYSSETTTVVRHRFDVTGTSMSVGEFHEIAANFWKRCDGADRVEFSASPNGGMRIECTTSEVHE